MTTADREYDDIISRALHAIVDPVEPAGDGLGRIREQLAEPWLTRRLSLLLTDCTALGWLMVTRCGSVLLAARAGLAAGRNALAPYLGPARAGPAASRRRHGRGQARGDWAATVITWGRPALTVAAAVLAVAAGVYGLGQIQATIAPSTHYLGSPPGGGQGAGAPLSTAHSETTQGSSRGHPRHPGTLSATPNSGTGMASPACSPVPTPAPSAAPSGTPTTSAPPSGGPSPSSSAPPTETPTPTGGSPSNPAPTQTPSTGASQLGSAADSAVEKGGAAGQDGVPAAGAVLGTGVPLGSPGSGGTGGAPVSRTRTHATPGWAPVVGTNVPVMSTSCPNPPASPGPVITPSPSTTPSVPVDNQSSSPPVP